MQNIHFILASLLETAILESQANRYPGAEVSNDGKIVECRIVRQCRVSTSRKVQKPAIMWKLEGKRITYNKLLESFE